MLQHVLSFALPVLGWWLLTGIINLAFAYKSQIEAWAESNPRLASLLKLSRALGFDPWNLLSSLKLLASKKLPDAQKADSPIAKLEQKRADAKRLGIDRDPPGGGATRDELSPPPPPPSIRPVGGFDAELSKWRHPSWELCLALLLIGCGGQQARIECTPTEHQKAKAAYELDVHVQCAAFDVLEECPAYPRLRADFERKIDAGCAQ